MVKLKRNSVPPLFWVVAFCGFVEACLQLSVHLSIPVLSFLSLHQANATLPVYLVAFIFAAVGAAIILIGAYQFKVNATTVNPMHPERTSVLVQGGVYRFTRNPMYLGMLFVVIAFWLVRFSVVGALGPVAFVYLITRMQIKPEEQALTGVFGEEYKNYLSQVRRWL